jgi:nucleotide-binding universal stress UspA family protein
MSARPIVVGTDGSEESLRAVDWATGEAARRAVPLRIVTVTAPPRPRPRFRPRPSAGPAGGDVQRSAYAETLTVTAGHAAGVAPGLAIETELLSGAPARMLIGDASAASMLVVAACGIGGYGETSAGPVSRYVAAHAACPVVVFRDQGPSVHGEVVVGVHDPDEAGDVLQFAFEEAAMRGARLLAVQAWHWIPPAGRPAPAPQEARGPRRAAAVLTAPRHLPSTRGQSAQAAARLAEVLRAWQQKYPRVPASPKVIHGHPGRVLASFSGMADLTVIGRHHEHPSLHPSPVLQSLLNHAQGSVAVIPAA